MNTLIPEFVGRYHSLKSIEKALREDIENGVFKKFQMPEVYMKLSMIRFAAREDWREYLLQAAPLSSDAFRKTLEKLEETFTNMSAPDLPEPPTPAR
ncbi:hypothetical protein CSW62_02000 [Caulobacter sp. FWC2]|nr:hypothetical protein CSW62_02000 [Caulobacter sp. FWC2]